MDLIPPFEAAASMKPLINIGSLFDIPTGKYVFGKHGESILNGGLGAITGVVGIGNNFKSTILHYMNLCALARIICQVPTSLGTYDAEINIQEPELRRFTELFEEFKDIDLFGEGKWQITDAIKYSGNKWWDALKDWLALKAKSAAKLTVETPFLDRDGINLFKMLVPTFGELDSLSEWRTDDIEDMMTKNEIGDSGANTLHMRQGLGRMRLLMELPQVCGRANHYMSITAQVGKEIAMASGPMPAPPPKKLQYLKNGDKIKGVSDKFFFLMSNCWQASNAAPLINDNKGPEYPREGETNSVKINTDLNVVKLLQLRSKTGLSGIMLEILVSQSEGVLPSLTEFHYCKENGRFGLGGNVQNYHLELYPNVALSRTTVRRKLDSDKRLARAMNITSEMLQMKHYWPTLDMSLFCTPKELRDDLTAIGYDVDKLLDTRGWWTVNNDSHPVPFLSTMDLMRMRKGLYVPYWMPGEDKAKLKLPKQETTETN